MKPNDAKLVNGAAKRITETLNERFKLTLEDPRYRKIWEKLNQDLAFLDRETIKGKIYNKFVELNAFYTRIIGLDAVKKSHEKVTALEAQLQITQDKRREIGLQLENVRKQAKIIQDELQHVRRMDREKYLLLITEDNEVHKLENQINETFLECDKRERELFTQFTNAIRFSYEKQREQVEYTKYIGLACSIIGPFLTYIYSTLKKEDLKLIIEEQLQKNSLSNSKIIQDVLQKSLITPMLLKNEQFFQNLNNLNLKVTKQIEKNNTELLANSKKMITTLQKDFISPLLKQSNDQFFHDLRQINLSLINELSASNNEFLQKVYFSPDPKIQYINASEVSLLSTKLLKNIVYTGCGAFLIGYIISKIF